MKHTYRAEATSPARARPRKQPEFISLEQLTIRERQVLDLLLQGLRMREIAGQLDIAERTVKAHKRNLLYKMKVTSLLQIALKLPRS